MNPQVYIGHKRHRRRYPAVMVLTALGLVGLLAVLLEVNKYGVAALSAHADAAKANATEEMDSDHLHVDSFADAYTLTWTGWETNAEWLPDPNLNCKDDAFETRWRQIDGITVTVQYSCNMWAGAPCLYGAKGCEDPPFARLENTLRWTNDIKQKNPTSVIIGFSQPVQIDDFKINSLSQLANDNHEWVGVETDASELGEDRLRDVGRYTCPDGVDSSLPDSQNPLVFEKSDRLLYARGTQLQADKGRCPVEDDSKSYGYLLLKNLTEPITAITLTHFVCPASEEPCPVEEFSQQKSSIALSDIVFSPLSPDRASVEGTVWRDDNMNGRRDDNEPGINMVRIILSGGEKPEETMTDSGGFYGFTDLTSGAYTVTVATATLPAYLTPTYDVDGVSTPHEAILRLDTGERREEIDFGYAMHSSIAITKRTNGQDAKDPDDSDVPFIAPGEPVTWTYEVLNTGTVAIPEADITVTDTVEGSVTQIVDKGDGDAILAPAESWLYQLVGTAIDLGDPPANPDLALVPDVCTRSGLTSPSSIAYTNIATISIPGVSASDASSYCNPSRIAITKRTNGQDANDPNGDDVPFIAPGAAVTWTYEVSNNGGAGIAEADLIVTDNVVGAVTEIAEKGDGDAILAPGEMWIYRATGQAIDLRKPPDDPALVIVPDACTRGGAPSGPAYTNVGTVSTPDASASDLSSYCNPPALTEFLPIVSQQELDWGDNPPPFATLAEENGPRHLLAPAGPMLGARVDAEGNGLPSEAADADDLNPPGAPDDEDGLLPVVLERGSPATVTITATNPSSVAATIHGWIDLNFDGMFAVSEHSTETIAPGTGSPESFVLNFDTVGYYPPESSTYARFRITTDPALVDAIGLAADGEVEDYRLAVEAPPVDWSDAPSSFNRTAEGQLLPPAHRLRTDGPRFGIHADAETVDQPSDGADGDDLNPFEGPDDEDGLLTAALYGGHPASLEVAVSSLTAGAEVVAWLDLNANGSFDTNERQAVTVEPSGQRFQTVSLAYPDVYMPFTVDDPYYLRLRVSTDPTIASSPLGYADDGEVEDHWLTVRPTTLTVRISDIGEPAENLVQRRVTASLTTSDGTSLAHQFFGNIVIETPGECSQLPPDAVPPGGWRPLNSSGEFSVDYTSCLSESAAMNAAAIETVNQVTDTGCRLSFPGEMQDVITVTVSPVGSGAPPNLTCVLEIATAITLAAFDAYAHDDGTVTITWTTAVEIDNAGFNLYRAPAIDGPYVRINPQLIAGQGTGEGATYSFVDRPPPTGMLLYKLEDVDYNGTGTFHGPISPVPAGE